MAQMLICCGGGAPRYGVGRYETGRGVGVADVGMISAWAGAGPRDSPRTTSDATTGAMRTRTSLFIASFYVASYNNAVNMGSGRPYVRLLSVLGLAGQAPLFAGRPARAGRCGACELE